MGRVSKYKKIRACDPYSKQNGGRQSMTGIWGLDDDGRRAKRRSKKSEALRNKKRKRLTATDKSKNDLFDVPPSGKDDFDLRDVMALKTIKPPTSGDLLLEEKSKPTTSNIAKPLPALAKNDREDEVARTTSEIVPDVMVEEKRVARILKIAPDKEASSFGKASPSSAVEKLPGESRKAFQRRFKSETRQLIKNEALQRRNPEKRQRKKDFLNSKKRKAKSKSNQADNDYFSEDEIERRQQSSQDGFITGEQAVARAKLGDQVERPPVFEQLPRGAKAKMTIKPRAKTGGFSVDAEQKAMELMRLKVQSQYALIKAKRRKTGDFHL